jgi:hypothetical protein
MKLNLMLHDDWELYGDGSGDIEELMFDPAKKILDACDEVGAKYTFFAEVGQQFAMLESGNPNHRRDAQKWEQILKDAVRRGHDVQLHLHPQWIGARFEKNQWLVDTSKWSTARLDRTELLSWLKRGSEYFKTLFSSVDKNYRAVAYRCGGYMAQPSGMILSVLKELGIIADMTVIPGLHLLNDSLGDVDFTRSPSTLIPWSPHPDNIAREGAKFEGILCFPTFSFQIHIPLPVYSLLKNPLSAEYVIRKFNHDRKRHYVPLYFRSDARGHTQNKNSFIKKMMKTRTIVLDFGALHHSVIESKIQSVLDYGREECLDDLPLVLSTHSKSFFDIKNFERLLSWCETQKDITFATTQIGVKTFMERRIRQEVN